jgi:RES domain-containing protein
MIVYRLCKSEWKHDLSGRGAELAGGRWNSKGVAMVYTSSSRALCMAEIAVHVAFGCIPEDYVMVEIKVSGNVVPLEISMDSLPAGWQRFEYRNLTQALGNSFIRERKGLLLKVPSAVVQGDWNYLLNPVHPSIRDVKVISSVPFRFDERLFG